MYDQSLLLTKQVTFAAPAVLNPTNLLAETDDSSPTYHCADILAEEAGTRNDLKDQPYPGSLSWYTDSSCFVVEGKRKTGTAVVDGKQQVVLPEGRWRRKPNLWL